MQFPDFPTQGQQVIEDETSGRTWEYDGQKWVLVGAKMGEVDFKAEYPIEVEQRQTDGGKVGAVTYSFDMTQLPRINPN
jgi:hypothetical protein